MNQKYLRLAQMFARAIQDQINYDLINDSLIFGNLLTDESIINSYITQASNEYFKQIIQSAEYKPNNIIISYPELLNYVDLTLTPVGSVNHNRKNIYKLLSNSDYEAVDNSFIPYIIQNNSFFRNRKVIAFDDNMLYYTPSPLNNQDVRIYYVQYPLHNDGTEYGFNTVSDIVWNERNFADIVAIAVKMYKIDDYQEDI